MPYSFELKPRMSATARACRAIVAARELDPALGEAALRALQLLHFTTPGLLDDDEDLRAALRDCARPRRRRVVEPHRRPGRRGGVRGGPVTRPLRGGIADARPGPLLHQ